MPISRRTHPALRTPQARVLKALMPADPSDPPFDWPILTRARLGVKAGYTGTSGTVTRALNGLREGSSSGSAHPGLLTLGLAETVVLDIDRVSEVNYRITAAGIRAYQAYVAVHTDKLPEVKDAAKNTNRRHPLP